MTKRHEKHLLRLKCSFLSAVTAISVCTAVQAAPSSKELEDKTSSLRVEMDTLKDELSLLSSELEETSSQIEELSSQVEKGKLDLAAAKLNEKAQYASMKERIKFMYEEGNLSLLNILCGSQDMTDFLNKAEYITTISEYDRKMLDKLHKVCADVEKKQESLEKKQKKLSSLAEDLEEEKNALTSKLSSVSSDMEDYSSQLARAKEAEDALKAAQDNDVSRPLDNEKPSGKEDKAPADETADPVPATPSDVALLAAILECEAGTNYEGMLAVGTVIMNRVESPRFPNTIPEVVYQPGQFYPAGSSVLNNMLAKGPSSIAYSTAQEVIGGARHSSVADCYFFYSDWYAKQQGVSGVNVGGNVFFSNY